MLRTIFSFIGALIGYFWSFISSPLMRIVVPLFLGLFLLFCIVFGFSFIIVYKEIFFVLFILITLGIWVPRIRPVRNFLLTVWAIWFVFDVVFLGIVFPAIDNLLINSNPAYNELKQTLKKFSTNRTEESIISMKKEMMNSEAISGTFGKMKEQSPAYDENGDVISDLFLEKGQKIMSLGTESKKQADGSEGMAYVSISNEHGHFVKGVKALVPIRIIDWETKEEKSPQPEILNSGEWQTFYKAPLHISDSSFNTVAGVNGERLGTGEVFLYQLPPGKYRFLPSGSYEKRFRETWYEIPFGGIRHNGSGVKKPFSDPLFGAVVFRFGEREGLSEGEITINSPTCLYLELNINRDIKEYRDSDGTKIRASELVVEIQKWVET